MTARKAFDAVLALAMAATLFAVASMAFKSAYRAHPDEKDHVSAGQYYMEYWDPPAVGDARAKGAYSNYGVSYLNQLDAVYFFAGKFARVVKPLVGRDYLALRLFNVALLAGLMVLAWRLPGRSRILFLPLFISPQPWYIFSYFNGDALPLALSLAAAALTALIVEDLAASRATVPAAQGAGPDAVRAFPPQGPGRGKAVLLGLTLGLLAISKQNYYVFLVFFVCLWLALAWRAPREGRMVMLRRAGLAFALAAAVFGARFGAHLWTDSRQPPDAEAKVAEKMATEEYKPSKQAEGKGFWGLNMRAQGVTWVQMFTGEWKWHIFTYRSSFGKYGAMDIEPPLIFYRYIGWMFEAFLLVFFAGLSRGAPPGEGEGTGRVEAALLVLFSFLTLLQSFLHSWIADFQAQGRYLFPMLAMMACALIRYPKAPSRLRQALWAVGLGMWGMSLWSFVAVGLAKIPR